MCAGDGHAICAKSAEVRVGLEASGLARDGGVDCSDIAAEPRHGTLPSESDEEDEPERWETRGDAQRQPRGAFSYTAHLARGGRGEFRWR